MNVLFDTNVIIDLWDETDDFASSYEALDVAVSRKFKTCIAATSAPSIMYLLPARKIITRAQAHEAFGRIIELFEVLDVTAADCRRAHEHYQGDYEDDLIAWTSYRHNMDLIVTRNTCDFAQSPVPAITPEEFVRIYKPPDLEYGLVDLN